MVRGRDGLAILIATLAALALALVAKDAHLLDGVEDQSVGMRFQARGTQVVDDVAVVAIDDVTFSDLELQWPFKRSLHPRAIDTLRRAGARRIVYDVQFTEPTAEREDMALFRGVERSGGLVLATTETDGHGGTNVLGGDETSRRRAPTPRRRTSRRTAAGSSTGSRTPPAACAASGSSRPPSSRAGRSHRGSSTATAGGSTTRAPAGPSRRSPSPTSWRGARTRACSATASWWSAPPRRRSRTSTPPRPPPTG